MAEVLQRLVDQEATKLQAEERRMCAMLNALAARVLEAGILSSQLGKN